MVGTDGQATGGIQANVKLGLEWLPSTSPLPV